MMHAMFMANVNAMTAAMANVMVGAIADVRWLCASYVVARLGASIVNRIVRKECMCCIVFSMYNLSWPCNRSMCLWILLQAISLCAFKSSQRTIYTRDAPTNVEEVVI
jgi:hypothetical protein